MPALIETRKKVFPWIFIAGGMLLILAGITFAWLNRQAAPVETPTPTPASVEQVERISLADAKAAFDSGKAIFLDVRDVNSYAAAHIPGAVLIPLNDLATRLAELDQAAWIISYCT